MYYVFAPIGGFGNHTRLMILLSDKFLFYFNNKIIASNINQKLKVVDNAIYAKNKKWNTWINNEWKFRESFHKSIIFDHSAKHCYSDNLLESKFIGLSVNPGLCHRCYFKMNSSLNRFTTEEFLKQQQQEIDFYKKIAKFDSRFLLIEADNLYNPILNKDIYYQMIEWFDADDKYEYAAKIHTTWFELHQRAEREFVEYVNNLYGNSLLNNY